MENKLPPGSAKVTKTAQAYSRGSCARLTPLDSRSSAAFRTPGTLMTA
ncbi:MAG: hypothetical protein JRN65_03545 [Nitrososphaerota archaeon]|jgi:hypothetical protein|nr:hypothetical protein [Nitrososphaerota archaeon]MDG6941045.1 hypothetical protein [Nitrososphaerota archaeon]MDG6977089.1 hypothetical protein [Nitrososphaerota archaeon]